MLIYLDMCSIHRPLDDKTRLRILVESEAVLGIIALCESGQVELVSSDALEYEAGRNPQPERKAYAFDVLGHAQRFVQLSPEIEARALAFIRQVSSRSTLFTSPVPLRPGPTLSARAMIGC
jgi:hypothetical protein